MNPLDHQLQRLLRAAARATPADEVELLPYSLEQGILAAWHSRAGRDEDAEAVLALLRRVSIAAAAVALVALGLHFHQIAEGPAIEMAARIEMAVRP